MKCRSVVPPTLTSLLQNLRYGLSSNQILHRLPRANDVIFITVHQHLGRLRMGIIVRGHGEAISARAHDGEEIPTLRALDLAIFGKEVTTFAYRSDHVGDDLLSAALKHRLNLLVRTIQRWTDEIVHAAIDNHEVLVVGLLDVLDFSEKNTGIADNDPSRLENESDVQTFQSLDDGLGVFFRMWRHFISIADPQATAQIEIANLSPLFFQRPDQHPIQV